MNQTWHFHINSFMSFLIGELPELNLMDNKDVYNLLENTINKLLELTINPSDFVDCITDIIPKIKTEDVEYFINH